jgi:hypothetical protein
MSYSVVSKGTLSDEYGLRDIEDPSDLILSLEPILSSSEEEEEGAGVEEEPCTQIYHEYVTMANVTCFIVLLELVVFTYWIATYDYVWTPDYQGSWVGLDPLDEEDDEDKTDYSLLSARLSRWTEHPASPYNNTTYIGKSADEFVELLGVVLFIYLCIRCTCGRDPYSK